MSGIKLILLKLSKYLNFFPAITSYVSYVSVTFKIPDVVVLVSIVLSLSLSVIPAETKFSVSNLPKFLIEENTIQLKGCNELYYGLVRDLVCYVLMKA